PNSEVKRRSADGSVGSPHARVGHCQASNQAETPCQKRGVFAMCKSKNGYPYGWQEKHCVRVTCGR
ncbi:hypothetical protein, partial [Yersinia bercovieri]